jgi:hypothetical protein
MDMLGKITVFRKALVYALIFLSYLLHKNKVLGPKV